MDQLSEVREGEGGRIILIVIMSGNLAGRQRPVINADFVKFAIEMIA